MRVTLHLRRFEGFQAAEWRLEFENTGNYHLLLPLTIADHDWCAYQFHRPDLEAGAVLAFRRHASPFPEMELLLKEIEPEADYEVSMSPGYSPQPARVRPGRELASLRLTTPEKPGSLLLRYQKKA